MVGAAMLPQLAIWPTDSPRPAIAIVLGPIIGPAGRWSWINKKGLLWLGAALVGASGVFV